MFKDFATVHSKCIEKHLLIRYIKYE